MKIFGISVVTILIVVAAYWLGSRYPSLVPLVGKRA